MAEKVIVEQPKVTSVLPMHMRDTGVCPTGLEYLKSVDQLVVKQQLEIVELLTGCEMNNKYTISNSLGQQVFYAAEDTPCCMRICCGPNRGFTFRITDNNNQEIMRLVRPFQCCHGCFCCAPGCGLEMRIEAPPGQVVGYIGQMKSCFYPMMSIFDQNHDQIAQINSKSCCCCMCTGPCKGCHDVEYPISTMPDVSGETLEIGVCSKQWSGIVEAFTDVDFFNIRFPLDMNPALKATLLGAVFMVDFFFFEYQKNNNHH